MPANYLTLALLALFLLVLSFPPLKFVYTHLVAAVNTMVAMLKLAIDAVVDAALQTATTTIKAAFRMTTAAISTATIYRQLQSMLLHGALEAATKAMTNLNMAHVAILSALLSWIAGVTLLLRNWRLEQRKLWLEQRNWRLEQRVRDLETDKNDAIRCATAAEKALARFKRRDKTVNNTRLSRELAAMSRELAAEKRVRRSRLRVAVHC